MSTVEFKHHLQGLVKVPLKVDLVFKIKSERAEDSVSVRSSSEYIQ